CCVAHSTRRACAPPARSSRLRGCAARFLVSGANRTRWSPRESWTSFECLHAARSGDPAMSGDSIARALAEACPQLREAGPDDAVAGVEPRFVACPDDVTQAAQVMRAAAAA